MDQGLVHFIMPLTVLQCFLTVYRPHPLTIRSFLDILRLLRVNTAVNTYIRFPLANTRNCGKIVGNRDLYIGIAVFPAWPCHNMIYSFSHRCSSRSKLVLYMPDCAEYASCSGTSR